MLVCSSCNQRVVIMDSLAACERMQSQQDLKAAMLVPAGKGHVVKCEECIKNEKASGRD